MSEIPNPYAASDVEPGPGSAPTNDAGMSPPKSTLEITVRVVVLGLILSVVMGAANVYVGLKAGMTVSASIPAAVMAMLLFKLLFKNSTTLEANQVQTCACPGITERLEPALPPSGSEVLSIFRQAVGDSTSPSP